MTKLLQFPSEQKAAELWAGFTEDEQVGFWARYEAVLREVQVDWRVEKYQQAEIESARATLFAPATYGPPVLYSYILVVLFLVGVTGFIWGGVLGLGVQVGFCLLLSFIFGGLLWQANTFEVSNAGLTVYKIKRIHSIEFSWGEIKGVRQEEGGTKLVITTYYQKQGLSFKDTLPDSARKQFYVHMEQHINKPRPSRI